MGFLDKILGRKTETEEKAEPKAEPEPEAAEGAMEGPKRFEDTVKMMGTMSPEEMKASLEKNTKICAEYCGKCPTYEDTGETELLFCAKGKSEVITEEKGCTCSGCPVQANMALKWDYYCTKGSGREQAGL